MASQPERPRDGAPRPLELTLSRDVRRALAALPIVLDAATWASNNSVLPVGRIGVESDTGKIKTGDGVTAWNSLDYTRIAIGMRETGGPTTLALGAIADGQFLKRSGASIVGAAGGGGGAPTTAQYLVGAEDGGLDDERVVTNTATITWDLSGGQAKANVASVPAHEHDAGDVVSGVLDVARVGTGSGDATKFLDGSGAFSAVTVPGVTTKQLGSQHDSASATGTEVTGLSTTLTAGTYVFTYYLITQAANATVGMSLGLNYTGTMTRMGAFMRWCDTGTTAITGVADNISAAGVESIHGNFTTNTKSTTTPDMGPLTNHAVQDANTLVIVEGIIVVSDGGDLELWHASDAANNTSIMVGSSVMVTKIAAAA